MSNDERNPKFQCRTTLRSVASGFVIQIGEAWFMESPLVFGAVHWDHEPRQLVGRGVLTAPRLGGLGTARPTLWFMESAFSLVSVSEPRKERKTKGHC